MNDFEKQLQRLKRNPVFAKACDKPRTKTEVAFYAKSLFAGIGFSSVLFQKSPGKVRLARKQIGFKVVCVFSGSATNSGSVRDQGLTCVSGAAEGAIAPLAWRRRFRKGGKRRLLVERPRDDVHKVAKGA